jgi:hypothetical protein
MWERLCGLLFLLLFLLPLPVLWLLTPAAANQYSLVRYQRHLLFIFG